MLDCFIDGKTPVLQASFQIRPVVILSVCELMQLELQVKNKSFCQVIQKAMAASRMLQTGLYSNIQTESFNLK